jgi:hypothetical protein
MNSRPAHGPGGAGRDVPADWSGTLTVVPVVTAGAYGAMVSNLSAPAVLRQRFRGWRRRSW